MQRLKNTPSLVDRTAQMLAEAHDLHQEVLASARRQPPVNYHPEVARLMQKLKDKDKNRAEQ